MGDCKVTWRRAKRLESKKFRDKNKLKINVSFYDFVIPSNCLWELFVINFLRIIDQPGTYTAG